METIHSQKILILFSGSLGHYFGFTDFINRVLKDDFEIFVASHKIGDLKRLRTPGVNFYQLKSLPALLDYEFHVTNKINEIVKLKADDVLLKARRDQLSIIVKDVDPDIIIIDTYTFTDALILKEVFGDSNAKLFFYQTRLSTELNNNWYGSLKGQNFIFLSASTILRKQKFRRIKSKLIMPGHSKESQLRRYFVSINKNAIELNFNRAGMPSLTHLPELLMSSVDSSTFHAENQIYTGFNFKLTNNSDSSKKMNILVSGGSGVLYSSKYFAKYFNYLNQLISYFKDIEFFLPRAIKDKIESNKIFY